MLKSCLGAGELAAAAAITATKLALKLPSGSLGFLEGMGVSLLLFFSCFLPFIFFHTDSGKQRIKLLMHSKNCINEQLRQS